MSNLKDKFSLIRAFCIANYNAAEVAKYSRYFSEGYDGYGLKTKVFEAKCDELFADWFPELGVEGFLDLGDILVSTGKFEEGSFALRFATLLKDHWTPAFFTRIGRWFEENGYRNWGHTDVFAGFVVSGMLRKQVIGLGDLADWFNSPHRWKRRCASVSLVLPMRDKTFPIGDLLSALDPVMSDPEKVVQQGVGSTLKQFWSSYTTETEAYLLKWRERASPLILTLAIEKMPKERKSGFRRSK